MYFICCCLFSGTLTSAHGYLAQRVDLYHSSSQLSSSTLLIQSTILALCYISLRHNTEMYVQYNLQQPIENLYMKHRTTSKRRTTSKHRTTSKRRKFVHETFLHNLHNFILEQQNFYPRKFGYLDKKFTSHKFIRLRSTK